MLRPLKQAYLDGREAIVHTASDNGATLVVVAARGVNDWAAYYAPFADTIYDEIKSARRTARLGEKLSHEVAYAMFGHLVGEWGSYRR